MYCCFLVFSVKYFPFFRGNSITSSVRYFFVEAYLFINICPMEIFVIVYLPSVPLCEVSKTLRIFKIACLLNEMPFLENYTQRVLFRGKLYLGHSLLLFPHLHFVSLTTKNKLKLDNDRMLELHKKRFS